MNIIIEGIPGTSMPPNNYSALEAGMIVAYLRGIAAGDNVVVAAGDLARGKALFEGKGKCATCHSAESRTAPLAGGCWCASTPTRDRTVDPRSERRPASRLPIHQGGDQVWRRGHRTPAQPEHVLRPDLDSAQNLRAFDKADLREFVINRTSEMPSYRGALDTQEVADLVAYLTTLRGRR